MEQKTLAWHETLELHEITAYNSIGLMKLKKGIEEIEDTELKGIYTKSIEALETSIKELMQFYPYAPKPGHSSEYRNDVGFFAGDLLAFTKSGVRNYAVAITETATPQLRDVLTKQLNIMIKLHEQIFMFMYKEGLYPSYDLKTLLEHDVTLAHKALSM
ncbi:spore coat protein [Bacillus suaedaesalsae]|uniref:Spore coat protein n=1 Tax=Bacillus suaedaesalsae TaxID=2810349 RepID=A0ABS2DJW8_9BACI|nr:spore coat protein [Bacillus suaedaesalsae]MBM6618786.1 spore coat protein [Bacillus suaedaesalsae]